MVYRNIQFPWSFLHWLHEFDGHSTMWPGLDLGIRSSGLKPETSSWHSREAECDSEQLSPALSTGLYTQTCFWSPLYTQQGTHCSFWEVARNLWETLSYAKSRHRSLFLLQVATAPLYSLELQNQSWSFPTHPNHLDTFKIIASSHCTSLSSYSLLKTNVKLFTLVFILCLSNSDHGPLRSSLRRRTIIFPISNYDFGVWVAAVPY